jgi:shikimate kinase
MKMPSGGSEPPVFLVGMMGAGKSSVGARLAAAIGRRFVDLDTLVEEWAGEPIAALFAAGREDEFRELERSALRGFDARGAVVATGGGTVVHGGNLEWMLARGRVAYLRARPDTLAARLEGSARPLLEGHEGVRARAMRLATLLDQRRAAYEQAHLVLDTEALSEDEVVAQLRGWVEGKGG